jgi:hypothetical protein
LNPSNTLTLSSSTYILLLSFRIHLGLRSGLSLLWKLFFFKGDWATGRLATTLPSPQNVKVVVSFNISFYSFPSYPEIVTTYMVL